MGHNDNNTDKGGRDDEGSPTAKRIFFFLGSIVMVLLILLVGAVQPAAVGRYRISTVIRGNFTDVYIVDTTTGVVKWVGGDEGKPFDAIKGR